MKLEEGRHYTFHALKTIKLPDSSDNLILTGPDNKKYLLPLIYYKDYNLTDKKEIVCKVDKINCSGKVFLEPIHPSYIEGDTFSFIVESINHNGNINRPESYLFSVIDIFGNIISVPTGLLDLTTIIGSEVKLKVERISKGKIHFSQPEARERTDDLAEGGIYDFIVAAIEHGPDSEDFYVVKDINNKEHRLPVRYYNHYGFKEGDSFRGKILRYSPGGPKTIEPENPWYSPGDVVEVTVGNCTTDETGEQFFVDVFDNKGFEYMIKMSQKPVNQILKCTVLKIRKGRPVLIPSDER